MKCLLDLDGVLVDLHRGIYELHNIPNPYLRPENLGVYSLEKTTSIPASKLFGPMGEDFWANLRPTDECVNILRMLEDKFGGQNIYLLTAPIDTHGCLEGKRRWIERNLPYYKRRFLIGPPKEACAGPDSVLIDDSDNNVKAFHKKGGKTILLPRPWNAWHMMSNMPLVHLQMMLEYL